MHRKQQFGQFFTKNTDYILSGMSKYVKDKNVTDPFAGAGDLLLWAKSNSAKSIIGFDIDDTLVDNDIVYKNDSLNNMQKYEFVLTNPPYLYQNKMEDNSLLKYSKHTDLYQLSLEKIMDSDEGIVIVPINFLSAENSKYIRQIFLEKFEIVKVNYFTEQVFEDTTYNVIAFYYRKKVSLSDSMTIKFNFYPENICKTIKVYRKYNWQIGGDFLACVKKYENKLKIRRLEEEDIKNGEMPVVVAYNHLNNRRTLKVDKKTWNIIKKNIVILRAIDTGTNVGRICLEDIRKYGYDALVSIKSSRNQINLIFPDFISISEQEKIIELFNNELDEKRREYNSLFMTNYRDKDRKRISFGFAYDFINYLYFDKLNGAGKRENMFLFY